MTERPSRFPQQREEPRTIRERISDAVDRVAEALDAALRGPAPEPAYAPVRRPTPEELARYRRARRRS